MVSQQTGAVDFAGEAEDPTLMAGCGAFTCGLTCGLKGCKEAKCKNDECICSSCSF